MGGGVMAAPVPVASDCVVFDRLFVLCAVMYSIVVLCVRWSEWADGDGVRRRVRGGDP